MKARIALGVCLLVACGDDGGDDAVPQSGVPNVAVNTLSNEDATKLCQWMMPSLAEAVDSNLICLRSALQSSTTKDACLAAYSSCMANPTNVVLPTTCDAAAVDAFHTGCDAKVVGVEDCLLDGVEQTRQLKMTLSCDDAGKTSAEVEPTSCKSIAIACIPT